MPVCREALAVMFHFMDTDGSNTIERSPRRAHAPFMRTLADALNAHPSEHAVPSMRKVPSAGGTMGDGRLFYSSNAHVPPARTRNEWEEFVSFCKKPPEARSDPPLGLSTRWEVAV